MSPDRPASPSPTELAPQDVVLRFLESTGRPSEARLYLEMFRARPREEFAAIAIDANVMAGAADAVVQDLRFLAALDLFPTVVLGIFQPADAAAHARALSRHLGAEGVAIEELSASEPDLARRITAASAAGRVPALVFAPSAGEQPADRLDESPSVQSQIADLWTLGPECYLGHREGGQVLQVAAGRSRPVPWPMIDCA